MGIIKDNSTVVTYDVTLDQIKILIANDLGVNPDDITVFYEINDTSGIFNTGHPINKVTNIKVKYNKK